MPGFAVLLAWLGALPIKHDFDAPVTFATLWRGVGRDRISIRPALGAQPGSIADAAREHRAGHFRSCRRKLDVRWESNRADWLVVGIAEHANRALLLLQCESDAVHERLESGVYRRAA